MPVNETLLHNWFFGNHVVKEVSAILFAYAFGAIPIPAIVAWLFASTDERLTRSAGAFVWLADACKGFIPIAIVAHGAGISIALLCGAAVVAGDVTSPFMRLRGGTGVAAAFGALAVLSGFTAFVFAVVWLVVAIASRTAVVASLLASVVVLVPLWFAFGAPGAWYAVVTLVLIAFGHRGALAALGDGSLVLRRERPETHVTRTRRSVILEQRQAAKRLGV